MRALISLLLCWVPILSSSSAVHLPVPQELDAFGQAIAMSGDTIIVRAISEGSAGLALFQRSGGSDEFDYQTNISSPDGWTDFAKSFDFFGHELLATGLDEISGETALLAFTRVPDGVWRHTQHVGLTLDIAPDDITGIVLSKNHGIVQTGPNKFHTTRKTGNGFWSTPALLLGDPNLALHGTEAIAIGDGLIAIGRSGSISAFEILPDPIELCSEYLGELQPPGGGDDESFGKSVAITGESIVTTLTDGRVCSYDWDSAQHEWSATLSESLFPANIPMSVLASGRVILAVDEAGAAEALFHSGLSLHRLGRTQLSGQFQPSTPLSFGGDFVSALSQGHIAVTPVVSTLDYNAWPHSQLADAEPSPLEWFAGSPSHPDGHFESDIFSMHWHRNNATPRDAAHFEWSEDLTRWNEASLSHASFNEELDGLSFQMALPAEHFNARFIRFNVAKDRGPISSWSFELLDGIPHVMTRGNADLELANGAAVHADQDSLPALVLDGVDDYASIPLTDSLRLDASTPDGTATPGPFTLGGWVRLDPTASLSSEFDRFGIFTKGIWTKPPFLELTLRGGAFRGLHVRLAPNHSDGHGYTELIPDYDTRDAFKSSAWRHVALTRDSQGSGKLYLDGVLVGTHDRMDGLVDPTYKRGEPALQKAESPLNEAWIGRTYSKDGSYFPGSIGGLAVYRRAFNPNELRSTIQDTAPPDWSGWQPPIEEAPDIHVAPPPLGNDQGPGTAAEPFATIGKALDIAHDSEDGRRHIFVRHGVYREGTRRILPFSSARLPGELVITRDGVSMTAEAPGHDPAERVIIRGSITEETAPLFEDAAISWSPSDNGSFVTRRSGRLSNPHAIYHRGQRLNQVGDIWMADPLKAFYGGGLPLANNQPGNLRPGGFHSREALVLTIPSSGGSAITDGRRFELQRGTRDPGVFEFDELDSKVASPDRIRIIYSDGKDAYGTADGTATSKEDIVALITQAITTVPEFQDAVSLTFDGDRLNIEDVGDGVEQLVLDTSRAPKFASHLYDLYVKPTQAANLEDIRRELEVPYFPIQLWVRANNVKIKGFRFDYANSTPVGLYSSVVLQGHDIHFEDNEILDCDVYGLRLLQPVADGLNVPMQNAIVIGNKINRCGNSGISSNLTQDCILIGNETSHNNWRDYNTSWHAGGFKLTNLHHNLTIIGHTARYNRGPGMWFDSVDGRAPIRQPLRMKLNDIGVTVAESTSSFNDRDGIHFEISRNGRIFDNVFRYNLLRGFYLSESSHSRVERNLVVGNGYGGITFACSARMQTRHLITLPTAHPLNANGWNTQIYANFICAHNTVTNNILRNNNLVSPANHDLEDQWLAIEPGWRWGNLPTWVHGNSLPSVAIPNPDVPSEFPWPPLEPLFTRANRSDANVLWRAGSNEIFVGYSPSQFFQTPHLETSPEALVDHKGLDRADSVIDGAIKHGSTIYTNGTFSYNEAFPGETTSIDKSSVIADGFEFLDSPLQASNDDAEESRDRDADADGMIDWWEAYHGLNPRDPADAAVDSDEDGMVNLQEFSQWLHGLNADGNAFASLAEHREQTDPTRHSGFDGKARDLDGDQLPDEWERYYGFDPNNPLDGSEGRPAFVRAQPPGPLVNDSDADGLPDAWEQRHWGNLAQEANGDADGDGFANALEFKLWTLPNEAGDPRDADQDRLADYWEELFGLSTESSVGRDGPDGDPDGDGASNQAEFEGAAHPRNPRHTPSQE